jgi:hypothetical protein
MSSVLHPVWADWRSRAEDDFWFASSVGSPPTNLSLPVLSISGGDFTNVYVGDVLSVTNGTWSDSPTSFTYRWRHSDVPATFLEDDHTNVYTVQPSDVGHSITIRIAATNAAGTSPFAIAAQNAPNTGFVQGTPSTTYFQSITITDTVIVGPVVKRAMKPFSFSVLNTPNLQTRMNLSRTLAINVSGSVPIAKSIRTTKTFNTNSVSSFGKGVRTSYAFVINATPSVLKRATKTLSTTATGASVIAKIAVKPVQIAINVATATSLGRSVLKIVGVNTSSTPSLAKQVRRPISVVSGVSSSVVKVTSKTWTINEATSVSLRKQAGKLIGTSVTTSSSLLRGVRIGLTTVVHATSSILPNAHTTLVPTSHKVRGVIQSRRVFGGLRNNHVHGR